MYWVMGQLPQGLELVLETGDQLVLDTGDLVSAAVVFFHKGPSWRYRLCIGRPLTGAIRTSSIVRPERSSDLHPRLSAGSRDLNVL